MSECNCDSGCFTAAVQDSCFLIVPREQMQMLFPSSGTERVQKDVRSKIVSYKLPSFVPLLHVKFSQMCLYCYVTQLVSEMI